MKTQCPHCSTVYSVATGAEQQLGKIARCGKCQQTFRLLAWGSSGTTGEAFEALLEEFLLDPELRPAAPAGTEPDGKSALNRAPRQPDKEHISSHETHEATVQEAAVRPDASTVHQSAQATVTAHLPKVPDPSTDSSKLHRREVSSELVGSDDDSERAQEWYASMGLAVVAFLFTLALLAYVFWPQGAVEKLADLEQPARSQQSIPGIANEAAKSEVDVSRGFMFKPPPAPMQHSLPMSPPAPPLPPHLGAVPVSPSSSLGSEKDRPSQSPLPRQVPPENLPGGFPGTAMQVSSGGSPGVVNPPTAIPPVSPQLSAQQAAASVALIETPVGTGSGFVVADKILVTNRHVIQCAFAEDLKVSFSEAADDRLRVRKIVYEDWGRDLCLMEVQTDRPPLPIVEDYEWTREKVILISNPSVSSAMTLRNNLAEGTLMSLVTIDGYDFYQFSATVNYGSSGGPVLNAAGQVIAVVARKATEQATTELRIRLQQLGETFEQRNPGYAQSGLTYGIPVQAVAEALKNLKKQSDSACETANVEHAARVVVLRLAVLGNLYLMDTVAHAPPSVRQEWDRARMAGYQPEVSSKKTREQPTAEQLPLHLADTLHRELESEGRNLMEAYSLDLRDTLSELQNSEQLDVSVKEDLRSLNSKVNAIRKFAERPPLTLREYGNKFASHRKNLESSVTRVATHLSMLPAGPRENDPK